MSQKKQDMTINGEAYMDNESDSQIINKSQS